MPKVSATHNRRKPKILIVCGPTATGKTKLAVLLAKRFNGELVSADSRQIYTGVDVITGKDIPPGASSTNRKTVNYRSEDYQLVTYDIDTIPVWLYDVIPPHRQSSISLYRFLAQTAIDDIFSRGKLPIIVGGAGLYIDAIIHTPETIDIPPDQVAREYRSTLTVEALQGDLVAISPDRLSMMNASDKRNPRRLIRAIEIAQWQTEHKANSPKTREFDYYWVGLRRPIEELSVRIRARVRKRWEAGAVDEVKRLKVLYSALPGASVLGFIPIVKYLDGLWSETKATDTWVKDEIAYAKRQMVWFKHQKDIRWYDGEEKMVDPEVEKDVREWYT